MSLPQAKPPFGPADYLAWESVQAERHEYLDGEIFAMGGASDAHGTVALNLAVLLHAALRGTPCRPFIADMKVQVAAANCFFYPDLLVTCDPRDRAPEASHAKQFPSVIVEVLSPSTEAYDRGRKFSLYRQLESLQEYVLVSLDERSIEVFRRDVSGFWVLHPFALADELELTGIAFRYPVAEIFAGVVAGEV